MEMQNHANSRPICFLRSSHTYLTPNHFLRPTINHELWTEDLTLDEKYLELENYRTRMKEGLLEAYKASDFVSPKWKTEGLRAREEDFVMISRGKSKILPLGRIEYGVVKKVSEDGRTLEVRVCRSNKEMKKKDFPIVRDIECYSRNCYLIFRGDCKQLPFGETV